MSQIDKYRSAREGLIHAISYLLSGSAARSGLFVFFLVLISAIGWFSKTYLDQQQKDSAIIIEIENPKISGIITELDGKTILSLHRGFARFENIRPGTHFVALVINDKFIDGKRIYIPGSTELRLSNKDFSKLQFTNLDNQTNPSNSNSNSNDIEQVVDIVLDAGHGGEDPGGMGDLNGLAIYEKDVVLDFVKNFDKALNAKGWSTALTRSEDRYVTLQKRMELSRSKCGKVFVSLHADTYSSSEAHGVSIYYLNQRGAESELAKLMSESTNNNQITSKSFALSISRSDFIARTLLNHLKPSVELYKDEPLKAGFLTLKGGACPSLLVELGYMSNPLDVARLSSSKYSEAFAQSLAEGLDIAIRQLTWK